MKLQAPFFFTLETNDVNLLANPGFEDCAAGNPAVWTGAAVCKIKANQANSGSAFLQGNAGKFSVQKVTRAQNTALDAQTTGDVLSFGGYFKGNAAAKTVALLTIRYAGGVTKKVKLKLTASSSAYQLLSNRTLKRSGLVSHFGSSSPRSDRRCLSDDRCCHRPEPCAQASAAPPRYRMASAHLTTADDVCKRSHAKPFIFKDRPPASVWAVHVGSISSLFTNSVTIKGTLQFLL